MKKLVILLCMALLIMPATTFASTFTGEEDTTTTVKTLMTDKGLFIEPVIKSGSIGPFYDITYKLRWHSKSDLHIAEPISESIPMSRFQLIIDKDGRGLDVTMLESTDLSKDRTVLKHLQNEKLFTEPATFDGKPCNAIGIFCIRYIESSPFNMKFYAYPLTTTIE